MFSTFCGYCFEFNGILCCCMVLIKMYKLATSIGIYSNLHFLTEVGNGQFFCSPISHSPIVWFPNPISDSPIVLKNGHFKSFKNIDSPIAPKIVSNLPLLLCFHRNDCPSYLSTSLSVFSLCFRVTGSIFMLTGEWGMERKRQHPKYKGLCL